MQQFCLYSLYCVLDFSLIYYSFQVCPFKRHNFYPPILIHWKPPFYSLLFVGLPFLGSAYMWCDFVSVSHLFTQSSIDGHLGYLHIIAIVINVIKMWVHISHRNPVFISFGYMPRSGISGLYGKYMFNLLAKPSRMFPENLKQHPSRSTATLLRAPSFQPLPWILPPVVKAGTWTPCPPDGGWGCSCWHVFLPPQGQTHTKGNLKLTHLKQLIQSL